MNHPPGPGEGDNPWLEILPGDYEGHMGSPQVGQLQLLNALRVVPPLSLSAIVAANSLLHRRPAICKSGSPLTDAGRLRPCKGGRHQRSR